MTGVEVEQALADRLEQLLGEIRWLRASRLERAGQGADRACDLLARLTLPGGGKALLVVECKKELRPSMFRQLLDKPSRSSGRGEVVVRVLGLSSVSPRIAELCAENGWSWFDLAGNCRLDVPGLLHVHRTGIPSPHRRPKPLANLSTPEAGRVIRAVLHPEHTGMRWTQRYLSEHFGTMEPPIAEPSLGLVNKVVRHLRDEAFIEELPKGGFRVRDPLKLLFAWRDAYRFDRHERRNYFSLLQGNKLRDALASFGGQVGGVAAYAVFSAADVQAPHVRQAKAWLYVRRQDIAGFETAIRAKQVESGENLVVLITDDDGVFYLADQGVLGENRLACTNEVQTYVDLCHCGGRGAEAAEALLEQCLKPKWKASGAVDNR